MTRRLLAWFAKARRDLPWREEPRDPYRVWVSEVMLQQTRVEVVVPYFRRFIERFPTLRSLARAPLDDVLALWSGLGYYARARNMVAAAQAAGSKLPGSAAALRELPGFGPYTAAAVASLAYGEDVPLVDGNVERVLARLFRIRAGAREKAWALAAQLLPRGRAGQFNEALMELGATICTPRSPRCGECPLKAQCKGRDRPETYPGPRKRPGRPLLAWDAVALRRRDGAVLLARRQGALFGGLWDLPENQKLSGVRVHGALEKRGVVEQTLTHREVRVAIHSGRASGTPRGELRWVAPEELPRLGLSSLARKSLRVAGVT
jgi:A/G-specific adenine glycosylase